MARLTKQERAERKAERAASQARIAAAQAEASAALASDTCPDCGQAVRTNSALAGWVQCSGYGADGFRAPGSIPCNWQGFTR